MFYAAELNFFRKMLNNLHIDSRIITDDEPLPQKIDRGIREYLKLDEDYERLFGSLWDKLAPNTIYRETDGFFCRYIMALLPETENICTSSSGLPYSSA